MLPSQYLEKGWTKKVLAITNTSKSTMPDDPDASAWCMHGALIASYKSGTITELEQKRIRWKLWCKTLIRLDAWNDYCASSQKEVITLMKEVEEELNLVNNNAISF